MNWPRGLKIKVKYPLKDKTTFKIGGLAQYYYEPKNTAELKSVILAARREGVPVLLLGAGSNLLISDSTVEALVIKLNAPYFKRVSHKGVNLEAGAGVMLGTLVNFAQKNSLAGLEFLAGIPGSFGGSLVMNAGCWGFSVGDLVKEVEIMDYSGNIKKLKKEKIKFAYRRSGLEKFIILGAHLKLKSGSSKAIKNKVQLYLEKRRSSQDCALPNAGCIFKNLKDLSAGRLIDLSGLKGRAKGSAVVSLRHANFILNKGNARCADVLDLMDIIKKEVKKKFGVMLKPEIKIWK